MDALNDLQAWVNGEFRPVAEARVPVFDAGVFMGSALAEALRTFGWKPFRMAQHLDRLDSSLRDGSLRAYGK
jgi:D-alanine transaminase